MKGIARLRSQLLRSVLNWTQQEKEVGAMSPLLAQVLREIEQLNPEEQLQVISHATELVKRQTSTHGKPRRKWLDIAGNAPYSLVGEDAQEWVTRTRGESQQHRDRLLESKHED
ncbi:hypothetical protein [Lyngbya sp. CCY1209]|uniref:hypothetical protein n=1 Tax=Lyngbya sp. CCY1209 TaxID=2886103 RepID=UPI002D208766|nr:hypothetical protein [Lyngbya sp. CCY1209]MEB3886092.1 hypothetical protein [Lyngbya sp. CCY1209]